MHRKFKHVWQEYFPKEPPACTTVEVGDTFPFRGVHLNLDAVALAAKSKLKREALNDPDGNDVLKADHGSHQRSRPPPARRHAHGRVPP
jgi:hypothetical protein